MPDLSFPSPIRIKPDGDYRLDAVDDQGQILASAFRVEAGPDTDKWRVFPGRPAEQVTGFIDALGNYQMILDHQSPARGGNIPNRPVCPPAAFVNSGEGARWWLEFLGQLYLQAKGIAAS